MGWCKELRAWAVAAAAVFCLGSIGYRVLTAPEIPDLAPTITKLNGTITAASTALQGLPAVLTHVQTTSDAATGVLRSASPVVASFSGTAGRLNDAIDLTSHRLNDLCGAAGPCGTLADTNRTLATLRGTSGQVENALRVFNQHEGDLFIQESAAYAGMNKSVFDFDTLVSDPDLKANIHNSATITGNFAAISTDGKDWLHLKLHPTKKQGAAAAFDAAGDRVHHWMPSIF